MPTIKKQQLRKNIIEGMPRCDAIHTCTQVVHCDGYYDKVNIFEHIQDFMQKYSIPDIDAIEIYAEYYLDGDVIRAKLNLVYERLATDDEYEQMVNASVEKAIEREKKKLVWDFLDTVEIKE